MARLTLFVSLGLALSSIPSGLAGPACAKKNYKLADCVTVCKSRWGWSGSMMGTDPWGSVMKKVDTDPNTWDAVISKACGVPVISVNPAASAANTPVAPNNAQTTESANSIIVVTTASATSSAVASTTSAISVSTSSKVSSSALSASASPSALGFLASARHSSSSTLINAPRPTQTRITTVRQAPTTTAQPATPKAPAPTSNSVGTTGSSGGTSNADIQAYLAGHNSIRAQHGAAPLSWSDNLAAKAQQWANGCVFKHSGGTLGPFGENLAAGTGANYGIAQGIKSWTDEVSQYNPSNPQASHFTQVVWKATTQVGCAVQSCGGIFDASFGPAKFFVCEYSVQGNVIGQFAQNVQV